MSLVYLFLKVYPFFGISLAFVFFDLTRNFRRKGNPAWAGTSVFLAFFALTTIAWIVFRGDRNADLWFNRLNDWLHHG